MKEKRQSLKDKSDDSDKMKTTIITMMKMVTI